MQLPNVNNAFIDLLKLKEYCLNDDHPIGKYKARVFRSALQFEKKDAQQLLTAILKGIKHAEAQEGKHDLYGNDMLLT
ncbi:MAG: DUF6883 domain-containing protein [Cyclobacteriaceae bacterium]